MHKNTEKNLKRNFQRVSKIVIFSRVYIFLIIVSLVINCGSPDVKSLNAESIADEQKIKGYTQFTLFKGQNYLGYVKDPRKQDDFTQVWEVVPEKLITNKTKQRLSLTYSKDQFAAAKAKIGDTVFFHGSLEKIQQIKLILENPTEHTWEGVYLKPEAKNKLELQKKKYINSILKVEKIYLEMETLDGKKLKTGLDFQQVGIDIGIEGRSIAKEKAVSFAENVYVGYKLMPPPEHPKLKPIPKLTRILLIPFEVKAMETSQKKTELMERLYFATEEALNEIDGIKVLERDPGIISSEKRIFQEGEKINYNDLQSLIGANGAFIGRYTHYEDDVKVKIYAKIETEEKKLIKIKPISLSSQKVDKNFSALEDKWKEKIIQSFGKDISFKSAIQTNKNALGYYRSGLTLMQELDENIVSEAENKFLQAIRLDNKFSQGYAMVCEAIATQIDLKFSHRNNLSKEEEEEKTNLEAKALSYGEKAVELNSDLSIAQRSLAKLFYINGENEKAISYVQKAVELDPKDAKAAWLLYFIKSKEDKRILYDLSNQDYMRAIALNPNLFEAYLQRGQIYENIGDYEKAINFYNQALERAPKYLKVYFALSRLYRQKGDFKKSLLLLDKATSLKPKDYRVWNNYARYYIAKKEYSKTESYYSKIRDEYPKDLVEILPEIVDFYANVLNNTNLGVKFLMGALAKNPSHDYKYFHSIGNLYYYKTAYDQAIQYYKKSLLIKQKKLANNHPEELAKSFSNIGVCYTYKKDFENAHVFHEKALDIYLNKFGEMHPEVMGSYNNIGIVYYNEGISSNETKKIDEAINFYKKAKNIGEKKLGKAHSRLATIYNNLGTTYMYKGNFDLAIQNYNKALEIWIKNLGSEHPQVATVYNNLGLTYLQKENLDKAIEYSQKAIIIWEKHNITDLRMANAYNNIGLVYIDKGEQDLAIEPLTKAIKIWLKKSGSYSQDVQETYDILKESLQSNESIEKTISIFRVYAKEDINNAVWYQEKISELKKMIKESL